ncbi:MAG: hypothetical protein ACP5JB_06315 [candidate division WOR-3 bacterium]
MGRRLILMLVLWTAIAGVCNRVPEREWERGAFEPIGGKPYKLPAGLEVRYIVGAEEEIPTSLLPLKLAVLNNTSRRIPVVMPAGLVFSPANSDYQYMMLLQEFSFPVPPDQDTIILLPTYCANEELDEPDEESAYEIAVQVWERELCELFDLLKGKHLDNEVAVELAQEALFEITDGQGLTDSTRLKLQQLP